MNIFDYLFLIAIAYCVLFLGYVLIEHLWVKTIVSHLPVPVDGDTKDGDTKQSMIISSPILSVDEAEELLNIDRKFLTENGWYLFTPLNECSFAVMYIDDSDTIDINDYIINAYIAITPTMKLINHQKYWELQVSNQRSYIYFRLGV